MTARFKQLSAGQSAGICIALLSAAAFGNMAHAEDYDKTFTVAHRASVRVETNDGSVSVSTGETQQVEFHVEYHGYQLNKSLVIESHQQGDAVELTARIPHLWQFSLGNTRRLHIEVRMPKDADLTVKTGDGAIKAGALTGSIDLSTGDGSLTVNALRGDIRLHSGDGLIEGSDLDGTCDAYSGDGAIRLTGRFDVLRARSGDGSIDVRALQGSKMDRGWSISSGDGSIDVALANDLPVDIEASTGDGHISSDIPITVEGTLNKSRIRGKMNGGGQTLTIHTGDGSIRLKQA